MERWCPTYRSSTRWSIECPNHFGPEFSRIFCCGLQLGLKVLALKTECLLEILRAQQLVNEGMIGGYLPFDVRLEVTDLLLIGIWKAAHRPLDKIEIALGRVARFLESIDHHGADGFKGILIGFHDGLRSVCERSRAHAEFPSQMRHAETAPPTKA